MEISFLERFNVPDSNRGSTQSKMAAVAPLRVVSEFAASAVKRSLITGETSITVFVGFGLSFMTKTNYAGVTYLATKSFLKRNYFLRV